MRNALLALVLVVGCGSKSKDWQQQTDDFMAHFAQAVESANGDCLKLTEKLEALAPEAKAVKAKLAAENKKFKEYKMSEGVQQKLANMGEVMDRCEEGEHKERFSKAVDESLLQVVPLFGDDAFKGGGGGLGGVFAPK